MKRKAVVAAVIALFGWGLINEATAAAPITAVLIVDVGSGTELPFPMGPGGMGGSIMTGNGPVFGQDGVTPFGVAMHSTVTSTTQGMIGQMESLHHRVMSFELPGSATLFIMMTGGNPWKGAEGIIMGGTGWAQGISGIFTVGDEQGVGTHRFPFTFTYHFVLFP